MADMPGLNLNTIRNPHFIRYLEKNYNELSRDSVIAGITPRAMQDAARQFNLQTGYHVHFNPNESASMQAFQSLANQYSNWGFNGNVEYEDVANLNNAYKEINLLTGRLPHRGGHNNNDYDYPGDAPEHSSTSSHRPGTSIIITGYDEPHGSHQPSHGPTSHEPYGAGPLQQQLEAIARRRGAEAELGSHLAHVPEDEEHAAGLGDTHGSILGHAPPSSSHSSRDQDLSNLTYKPEYFGPSKGKIASYMLAGGIAGGLIATPFGLTPIGAALGASAGLAAS